MFRYTSLVRRNFIRFGKRSGGVSLPARNKQPSMDNYAQPSMDKYVLPPTMNNFVLPDKHTMDEMYGGQVAEPQPFHQVN